MCLSFKIEWKHTNKLLYTISKWFYLALLSCPDSITWKHCARNSAFRLQCKRKVPSFFSEDRRNVLPKSGSFWRVQNGESLSPGSATKLSASASAPWARRLLLAQCYSQQERDTGTARSKAEHSATVLLQIMVLTHWKTYNIWLITS